jgi:hypothetical protein
VLHAIVEGDGRRFIETLMNLLALHEELAVQRSHVKKPEFFLSIPALGFSALALRQRLIGSGELSTSSVYCPIELLKSELV